MTNAHEGMADPRLQAEGELSMARLALDDGELGHAATHVANALLCDPALPEAHELLARLAADPRGGPRLFEIEQPAYLGTVIARAHVLASLGDPAEALGLLVSAQCHAADGPWADVPWVRDPALPGRLGAEEVYGRLRRLFSVMGDPVAPERRAPFQPYLELMRQTVRTFPGDAELLWTASIMVRRMGEGEEAVELARRSERAVPSFHAAMALGYAQRSLRRWDDAERAWLLALERDPGNLALYTDIGELLAMAGRPADGLAWVERALEQDPAHESAFPTACGMRFSRDGDVAHLVALADHLRERPGNSHADAVLTDQSQHRYWLGRVPKPGEAVINVLEQVLEAAEPASGGSLSLSAPEPPSALLAFSRALSGFTVEVTEVPPPDLRRPVPEVFTGGPVREVSGLVWAYDGTTARPAVTPPSPESAAAVRESAAARWRHLPAAYDDAVRLSGLPLADLLGVLAHPPEPPENAPASVWPTWIRAVQSWACLAIAHHCADEPWPGSRRRAVLVDLAYGPEDWTAEAALLALVTTAWVRPETRADVAELVGWRFMAAVEASRTRAVTILESLAFLVRATPQMNPDVRGLAGDIAEPPGQQVPAEPQARAPRQPRRRHGLFRRGS